MNPANHTSIQVEGDSKMSSKVVTGGSVISIPLTFQYRMTDYWGEGNMGGGRILGDANISTVNKTSLSNIQMANRIGIDIWGSKDTPVSYSIQRGYNDNGCERLEGYQQFGEGRFGNFTRCAADT